MKTIAPFALPARFTKNEIDNYRRAQLLNWVIILYFLVLAFTTTDHFLSYGLRAPLLVRIYMFSQIGCLVALAYAYVRFRRSADLEIPAMVVSLVGAWVIGYLVYLTPTTIAPLYLLTSLTFFPMLGLYRGLLLFIIFSAIVIIIATQHYFAKTIEVSMYINYLSATLLGGGIAYFSERVKEEVTDRMYINSVTDPLTGAWNRGMFNQQLKNEIARYHRSNEPFVLVMLDIDFFKQVNDTYGHHVGDSVLLGFVRLISKEFRESDYFARWGGEEFIILLTNTSLAPARDRLSQFRDTLKSHPFDNGLKITFSAGLCQYNGAVSAVELIQQSDKALYTAKQNGRDRIEVQA